VRPQLKPEEYAKRQAEVATANGLEVVNGKIPLPIYALNTRPATAEMTKVDLELATDHYKASQLAEKASAGLRHKATSAAAASPATSSACGATAAGNFVQNVPYSNTSGWGHTESHR